MDSPSLNAHLSDPALLPPSTNGAKENQEFITAYAPASAYFLACIATNSKLEITDIITRAEKAQIEWSKTNFGQRRKLLRTLLRWIVKDQEDIARVASRDTGKTMVDAAFGEILTSCEKLRWTIAYGETHLKPESRP